MTKTADPVPRTQPYSNLGWALRGRAAPSASASARDVVGASAAAWRRLISKSGVKGGADSRPSATSAASSSQTARTARSAWVRSARRPPKGPETNRTALPAANSIPSCSGASPRPAKNAGMNGEATPNAAYMRA
jgi:hypothetical protein